MVYLKIFHLWLYIHTFIAIFLGKVSIIFCPHYCSSLLTYSTSTLCYLSIHSWRRQWHPTPVLLPGKSYGRRSLVGYSPWGRWESDTAERLPFHFSLMHWRRKWQPTPVFLPGESQGRGSLMGCRLWGSSVKHDWSDLAACYMYVYMLYTHINCISRYLSVQFSCVRLCATP